MNLKLITSFTDNDTGMRSKNEMTKKILAINFISHI